MKRTAILEPWTNKEKLCLSSAVLRSGDQNWMSVSRLLKTFGEADRPGEWYAQRQCALQYEALLNNAGTSKRKKRSDKGPEVADSPGEAIVRRLVQERLEELYTFIETDKKEYNQLKKEIEDIESGRADDRLDEFEQEIEDDLEREGMQGSILHLHEERNRLDVNHQLSNPQESSHQTPSAECKVPTSPLLTSLLQSPTNYRASSMLSPSARPNDSPTLSRLLESPAKQIEPEILFQSPVKKEEPEADSQLTPVTELEVMSKEMPEEVDNVVEQSETQEIKVEHFEDINEDHCSQGGVEDKVEQGVLEAERDSGVQMQEVEVEVNPNEKDTLLPTPPVSVSNDESKEVEGEHEQFVEPEQEQEHEQSLVNLQDSDTMEEQGLAEGELDSQMVNMIVAGEGVITVNHDTSSEHLDGFTSLDIQHKDDSETAESVKEDSLDDIVEMNEAGKDADTADLDHGNGNINCSNEGSTPLLEVDQGDTDFKITLSEDAKEEEVEGAEVAGEMDSLGGAIVVEEEVEHTPTVHEVEVLVSQVNNPSGGKEPSDEDSMQDGKLKQLTETDPEATPETDNPEESQEEEEQPISPKTRLASKQDHLNSIEDNEQDDNNEDDKALKDIASTPPTQGSTKYPEEEGGPRGSKRRLISGSASDSKPSSPATPLLEDSKGYRSWKKSILLVYGRIAAHKNAILFLRPITNEDAPSYDSVVHRPIDLSTIKKRIESGELGTTVEFQRDLLIMFQNAIMYNNSRSPVYKMASSMQIECMQHIELMVEAMGEGVPWRKDMMAIDKLGTRGRGEAPKRKRVSLEEKINPKRRRDATT